MIRATNTIKHLDVKTRLFEEREGRERGGGGSKGKNPDPCREASGSFINLWSVLEH